MNTPRSFRFYFVRGLLGAALLAAPAFAMTSDELASLRAKAEAGNGVAQYNLGLAYAEKGAPNADPVEAYVWLRLAAENGATGHAITLVTSQMSAEQVFDAKKRLEQRRAELAARKNNSANSSPVSPIAAAAAASSPISAAPAPEAPISAAPTDADVSALQAELKKMGAELATAWKENDQLKATLAKNSQSANTSAQLQQERDQLRSTLAATNEELAKLRAASANYEGERNALQQRLTAAEQGNGLAAELANANKKLKAAESDLAQATAAVGELSAAKQTIAQLGEQIQKQQAENQRLASLAGQAGSSAEAKASAEKELATIKDQLASAQRELAAATEKASAAENAKKQLDETQIKLESALRSYDLQQKELDRVQKALANIDGERDGLTKQLAELKAAPPKADPNTEQRIAQLSAQLETARAAADQATALQKQLADVQNKLKSAEEAAAHANQEKDQLSKQLATAKNAPTAPSPEVTRLTAELTDARNRLAASEQALARARDDRQRTAQDAAQASKQEIAQLKTELQAAREKAGSSEEELAKANRERESLQKQLASATSAAASAGDVSALQGKLRSAEDALAAANAEKTSLSERLATAEKNLSTAGAAAAAAAPAVSTSSGEDVADIKKQLAETQSKLDAALRTYQLGQDEIDRLQKALTNIDAERAQLADRIHSLDTQASQAQAQAAVNQEAAAQLSAAREQLRQAQNQIAALAGENSQLKNRLALAGSPPASSLSAPTRPGSVAAQTTAVRAVPSPTPTPAIRTHVVAEGDTLTKIARRYYGSSEKWPQILEANRGVIKDVNNLTVGTTIKIP